MSTKNSPSEINQVVEVAPSDRWLVHRRLQELDIPCNCSTNKPLTVELYSPMTAIQVWSVHKQLTATRHDLIDWLNHCWQTKLYS